MKKLLGSLCIGFLFMFPFFTDNKLISHIDGLGSPLDNIRSTFVQDLDDFEASIVDLVSESASFNQGSIGIEEIQRSCSEARMRFKKVEYLFEYLQPQYTKNYINGAPLPKTDPTIPAIEIIAPCGLQTLDELIFSDDPTIESGEILRLSKKLRSDIITPINFLKVKNLEHRYVIEACREELLRIFTLGLTGFDTPGSGNAIPEAQAALSAIRNTLLSYKSFFDQKNIVLGSELIQSVESWENYLSKHGDFDNLDRIFILTNYFNPLYAGIHELQHKMNVEFKREVDPTLHPINYDCKNIFTDDFLSPSYYSEISSSDLFDEKKIELGKILFFDPVLSRDLSMSCATCHQPEKAFSDGKKKSVERKDLITRNSPGLINSVYYGKYFLDMREYDLERQVKHVMFNEDEFNMDFIELADRLKESKEYLELFSEAYGDRDKYIISTWSISNALAAYVTSLRSWNSPFDQYVRGEIPNIDESVKRGFNLFMGKAACGTCHFAPSFSGIVPPRYEDSESEVLGVLAEFDTINPVLDNDPGRERNKVPRDEVPHFNRSFKTLTVRNAELTGPYMHNGAFETLEELMVFYNLGGGAGLGLAVENQTLAPDALGLNNQEIADIISFMKSLTDTTNLTTGPKVLPAFENTPEWDNRFSTY